MKHIIKTLIVFTIITATPVYADINKETAYDIYPMLVTAKLAGACGLLKQIAYFQETTQLPNGNEFIARFFNSEAARLGKTLEEYLTDCHTVVNDYAKLSELIKELSGA